MVEAAYASPWLVQLHHAWCSAEHVYLVMDYLPGGDLMSRALPVSIRTSTTPTHLYTQNHAHNLPSSHHEP